MRKETLEFRERAPVVHVAEAEIAAPRALVFAAFAEAASWKHWFPTVRDASYTSPPPHGVGTIRRAHVGSTHWEEEMLAWEDGSRCAWTVTRASVPFARAQVESFEFIDSGDGTRVRWVVSIEPRWLARLGAPFAPRVIRRMLENALRNLGAHLERTWAGAPGPPGGHRA